MPRLQLVALAVILLSAWWLRWERTAFGLPYLHHWDEPQIASTSLQMMKSGDLNPHYFHYPSLLMYANLAVDVGHFFALLRTDPIPFGVERRHLDHEEIRLEDLQTRYDTGFHWEVSHPSFYLWNRRLSALLGVATVWLLFLLGRELGREASVSGAYGSRTFDHQRPGGERISSRHRGWVGLGAAALLAVSPFHIEHSSYVTTDAPMTFFALATIVLATRFASRGHLVDLAGALACAGLAVSTKYSAALFVVAPIAALAWTQMQGRLHAGAWRGWILVPTLPAAAFLLTTPYALLDLPAFLSQAGYEVYHYAVQGHGAVPVEAGWPHFKLILTRLVGTAGPILSLLVLLGLLAMAKRPWRHLGGLVLLAPALHLVAVAGTRTSFHRNLLPIDPFMALLAALGFASAWAGLARWSRPTPRTPPWRRWTPILLAVLVAGDLSLRASAAAKESHRLGNTAETRSRVVELLNGLDTPGELGIAAELRIHPLDLARLERSYAVVPHDELVCSAERYGVLVTARRYEGLWPFRPEAKTRAWSLNTLMPRGVEPRAIAGDTAYLDGLAENPGILVFQVEHKEAARPSECAPRADLTPADGTPKTVTPQTGPP